MNVFGLTRKRTFYFLNIIIPLFLGLSVYILFRPDAIISECTYSFLNIQPTAITVSSELLRIIICYYMSDFLWAYSLTFIVVLILGYSKKNLISNYLLCLVFVIVVELLQQTGLFQGIFDISDIIVEALAVFSAFVFIYYYEECAK